MNFKSCFSLELFLVLSRNFTIYSKEVWGDEEDFDSDTDEPISRSYLKSMYGIIFFKKLYIFIYKMGFLFFFNGKLKASVDTNSEIAHNTDQDT